MSSNSKNDRPVQMVSLTSISNKFDVRTALDEDRVVQFVGLYEAGVDLPPVKLVKLGDEKFAYIDGRHRGAARAYLNLPDVPALIFNGSLSDNPVELFAQALQSNWGGAKPPTRNDITHTIIRMLEHGASQALVSGRLDFLPKGALRAYIAQARSTLAKRKLARAMEDVADGMTVEEAAKRRRVNIELIKNSISGKRGKKIGGSAEMELVIALKSHIAGQMGSANSSIGKKVQMLLQHVEDGEVTSKSAMEILKDWNERLRKSMVRVADWQARVEAISAEQRRADAA